MLLGNTMMGTALSSLASYFTMPSIGSLYYKDRTEDTVSANLANIIKKAMDALQIGIPIYADKYEEKGGNDIGQQILVSAVGSAENNSTDVTGSLVRIADNIVVDPKSWSIHGYIGVKQDDTITQFLMKMVPFMNIISNFGRQVLLETFRMVLRYICDARRPFKFNTADGDTVPSLIKSYSLKKAAENNNWIEIDIEIQEFRYLAMVDDNGNQRAEGFKQGVNWKSATQKLGRTALKQILL